ncbi:MAG: TlpA disulfide reductase family protein, partial [Candidatus Saganbacteria bacterium]|nr:TlpA disulfide reductase family protein [Candidatus Saganbacteria bacterium]
YDPGLTLDPIFTAPKIMDVFNEAKNEFQKERPAAPIAGIKQEPSPTIKQVQPGPQNVCAAGACPAEEKPQSSSQSISLIGQKTPSFALRDISSGNFFYADELIGKKPFVLIFWHAGCGGCESVMPILNEIIESYKDKPLYKLPSIIGMAIQERARNLEFIKNNGISFQNLEDKYMLTFQKFNSKYTPAIIFIDKEGIVKNILVGSAINKFGLEEEISHLTEFDVNEGKKPDQIGIKSEGIPQRIVSLNSGLGLGDEQCIKTMAELDAVIDRAMESAMNSDEVKKTFKGMGIKGEISFTFFVQQDGKLSIKTVSTNVLNKFIMPIVNALPEKITPLSPKGIANPGSQGIVEWETPPIKIERTIKITPGV